MRISIIWPDNVNEDKSGFLSHVDEETEDLTLQEFAELGTMTHIAPGIFKDRIKKQDHLESIQFVSFDFDEGRISAEEVHRQLKHNTAHVILASKNCFVDKGDGKGPVERFHVFIPLDQTITDVVFYKYVCRKFAQLNLWSADRNCMEPARYFYKHSGIMFIDDKAKPLEVDRFRQLMELERKPEPIFIDYDDNTSSLDRFKKTRVYQEVNSGGLKTDGNRYDLSNRVIGTMLKCGCSEQEIINIIDEHSIYGSSFTRKSIVRRIQDWR